MPTSFRSMSSWVLGATVVLFLLFADSAALAQSAITVTIDAKSPTAAVSPDFIGLSFEMEKVLPDSEGKYYFSPDNKALLATFNTLGIKSLRVGGNTADNPNVKVPGPADIDSLFAFAKAAGVKVIYTFRLRGGSPQQAAELAKYIADHFKSDLTCFAIGNEPNVFATEYPVYRAEWEKYVAAITAGVPDAKFCGPSATPGKVEWANNFVNDLAASGHVVLITQHDYPGNSGRKVTDTAAARSLMLSPEWIKYNEKFHGKFVPAVMSHHLPFRLEEANNFFHGGAKDVSDTLAAALWGLDYMYWWASHGASGINFHTGDNVAAADDTAVCRYAVFRTAADGFDVKPLGYAIKAFDLGSHGQLAPTTVASNPDKVNLTAYGVVAADKSVYVTLINKDHGSAAHEIAATIEPGQGYTRGQVLHLTGPGGDLAATSGLQLGGAGIQDDAKWQGAWTPLADSTNGHFTVKLPAATAAVVKLTAN